MINTIWISTAPRTGSMWLFNVTRGIFRAAGREVLPDDTPQLDEEMVHYANKFACTSQDPNKVWVLKVHNIMRPGLPKSKILTAHRDPRDVCASFKEFMNADFGSSLGCARSMVKYTNTYSNYDPAYLMLVAYHDIETRPAGLIKEIAKFLDVNVTDKDARNLAVKYSRKSVRQIIDKNDKSLRKKLARNKQIDRREIVYFSDSNYRAFDRKTGFQSGHVSQRKTGDWKKIFSETEQNVLNKEFGGWLKEHGYEI